MTEINLLSSIIIDQVWQTVEASKAKQLKKAIQAQFKDDEVFKGIDLNPRIIGAMTVTEGNYNGYIFIRFINQDRKYIFVLNPDTKHNFLMGEEE
jgi:transcription antitermination factor NusG